MGPNLGMPDRDWFVDVETTNPCGEVYTGVWNDDWLHDNYVNVPADLLGWSDSVRRAMAEYGVPIKEKPWTAHPSTVGLNDEKVVHTFDKQAVLNKLFELMDIVLADERHTAQLKIQSCSTLSKVLQSVVADEGLESAVIEIVDGIYRLFQCQV